MGVPSLAVDGLPSYRVPVDFVPSDFPSSPIPVCILELLPHASRLTAGSPGVSFLLGMKMKSYECIFCFGRCDAIPPCHSHFSFFFPKGKKGEKKAVKREKGPQKTTKEKRPSKKIQNESNNAKTQKVSNW